MVNVKLGGTQLAVLHSKYLPVLPGFLVSVNQTFPNTNVNCCPLLTQIVDDCRFTP